MHLQDLEQRPDVHAALTWLLGLPFSTPFPRVLRQARLTGLMAGFGHQCYFNGGRIEGAVKRSALFGTRPSVECLYGAGELLAHSQVSGHPYVRYTSRLTSDELHQWLSIASMLAHVQIKPSVVRTISAQLVLSATEVTADFLHKANGFLQRGPSHRLFGLSIIVETIIRSHPQRLVTWLLQNEAPEVADSVLGYFCERLVFIRGYDALHVKLLRTDNPFLQMLTGAALCGTEARPRLSFTAMYEFAVSVGVPETRAFMVALTAADYELRHGPRTDAQKQSLVAAMAACWPGASFTEAEYSTLQHALQPRWIELGVRLAEALSARGNPSALLDRVLVRVAHDFGYMDPEKALQTRPEVTPENLEDHLKWASRAFALRYRADSKGVGKQVGQQLNHLTQVASPIVAEPYALARFPRIHDVVSRYAGVLLLALRIARGESAQERKERRRLMKEALAQTPALLYLATESPDADGLLEEIARVCVGYMTDFTETDDRARWYEDTRMPSFARAMALWADPVAARLRRPLARELLVACMQPGPARRQETLVRRAVLVVDFALAASFDTGSKDLVSDILFQWQGLSALWLGLEATPQRRLAHRVYLALKRPGRYRDWLKSDPQWSSSRCRARV